jgi:plasmid stabilization system protein ParE
MKAKVIISTFAKDDLSVASKWYGRQQRELGKRFLNEIKEYVDFISNNPTAIQIQYDDVYRVCFTKVFPFGIHYKYLTEENEVHIVAILHTSRNPNIRHERSDLRNKMS